MEGILDRIRRAYYDGFINDHQKAALLKIINDLLAKKTPYIHEQQLVMLNKLCNIKINFIKGTCTSILITNKMPPLVDINPRNMFGIAMDNILFNVDFNKINNAVHVLQNIHDLFVEPIKYVPVLDTTKWLLEANCIFWNGSRFSLLPEQKSLVQHYFDFLPEKIRLASIEIYTFELTNVNATLKKLRDAMSRLQFLTNRFWKKSNNREIVDLFSANWIFLYVINRSS